MSFVMCGNYRVHQIGTTSNRRVDAAAHTESGSATSVDPVPKIHTHHQGFRAMASIGFMPCPNRAMVSRFFFSSL